MAVDLTSGGASDTVNIDTGTANTSQSITVPSDAELAVFFGSSYDNVGDAHPNPVFTLNSVNATQRQVAETTSNNGGNVEVLANPSTGTQTLAWNFGSRDTAGYLISVVFFKGNDTTTPVRSSAVDDTGEDLTGLTSNTGDMMVGACHADALTSVNDNGQTQLALTLNGTSSGIMDQGVAAKANSTTFNSTTGASPFPCVLAITIAAAGGGTSPKGPLGHPLHGSLGGPI